MPHKIIIAYRTQAVPGLPEPKHEEFAAPSNYRDPAKIAQYQVEKMETYRQQSLFQPYTATFAEVTIANPVTEEIETFKYREPGGDRQPVSLAIRSWILKRHPAAWSNSVLANREDAASAIFLGFNPRLFLKILGIECSLHGKPLPLGMWYGNTDHRDIEEAVKPNDFPLLTWKTVLAARGLSSKFDKWQGPGIVPGDDLKLVFELANQLGMLTPDATPDSSK